MLRGCGLLKVTPAKEEEDGEEDGKARGEDVLVQLPPYYLVRLPVGVPEVIQCKIIYRLSLQNK